MSIFYRKCRIIYISYFLGGSYDSNQIDLSRSLPLQNNWFLFFWKCIYCQMYIFSCTFHFLNIFLYVPVYVCVHYLYLFFCCGRTISYPEMSHRLNPMSTHILCSWSLWPAMVWPSPWLTARLLVDPFTWCCLLISRVPTWPDLPCPVLPVLIMVVPFVAAFLALRFQLCQQWISVLRFVQKTPLIEIVPLTSDNISENLLSRLHRTTSQFLWNCDVVLSTETVLDDHAH